MKLHKDLKKEIYSHKAIYILLTLVLLGGLFMRTYRIDQTLGFYFDQGRDAKVIWDFLYNRKLFLIGPTTGIAGIFRGPFYYYLITPAYFLGGGNPVFPSVFLSLTTIIAIVVMFVLGVKIHSRAAGLVAAIIGSFSLNILFASRWLSNPTPMLLLSMVLVYVVYETLKYKYSKKTARYKDYYWPVVAFLAGSSLFHFGSSGEFFYFPALLIVFLWTLKRQGFGEKSTINFRSITHSIVAFTLTALPLILFDLRHQGILSGNIKKFFVDDGSFKVAFWDVLNERISFYYDVFSNKIFHWRRPREVWLLRVVAISFFIFLPKLIKKDGFKLLLTFLLSVILGLLFFQGNFGNIYDYYLTGYYFIFILLFSIVMGQIWKYRLGKIFAIVFVVIFLQWEGELGIGYIKSGVDGPETIMFGNQKQAIEWVYQDADGIPFNVDVYVPPVIPHAYDYLFSWYGGRVMGYEPEKDQIETLYTLYEVDSPHPERLQAWLDRQAGIGVVEAEEKFGGITVQRRKRI
jgi:hypothetical protein